LSADGRLHRNRAEGIGLPLISPPIGVISVSMSLLFSASFRTASASLAEQWRMP
jgi:hypothetical protein